MKITNKFNLPAALVETVKKDEENHVSLDKHYGVTSLLNPIRQTILKKRYGEQVEVDVSTMVWSIFGQAVHGLIERGDKTGNAELEVKLEIRDGYFLRGRIDLYNEEEATIIDWKTTSAYKVSFGDFEDWRLQGLMYAFLLRKKGKYVEKLRFHALLKDWKKGKMIQERAKGNNYPLQPIWTWEYTITTSDMIEIERFIRQRFEDIIASVQLPDNELPPCTSEERWDRGGNYALKEPHKKSATKLGSTVAELELYAIKKGISKYTIEYREPYPERCHEYCLVNQYCDYYKKLKPLESKGDEE